MKFVSKHIFQNILANTNATFDDPD